MAYQIGEGCLNGCLETRRCLVEWGPDLFPNTDLSEYSDCDSPTTIDCKPMPQLISKS